MNEKEYKMVLSAKNALEKVKNKEIPKNNKTIKLGIERRQQIIDSWKGMGI